MGIKSTFQNAAKSIHSAFDDLNVSVTYKKRDLDASTTYNPVTGAFTEPAQVSYTISGIFTSFKTEDIDNTAILANDRKFMVPAIDLSFVPQENDYLTYSTKNYEIISIKKDPADAEYIFQLRPYRT